MKFLVGLTSLIAVLIAVSYVRTPTIPEVADSDFGPTRQAPENSRTPESFKELGDFLTKESSVTDRIAEDKNLLSTKFTPEQSAAVQRMAVKVSSSGICHFPVIGSGAATRFTTYSLSAKSLKYQFVLNVQNGNAQAARKNFEDLAALGENLSTAKNVGLVGYVVSSTVEGYLLNISETVLSSPLKADYSETVRAFLASASKNPILFKETLLFEADETVRILRKAGETGDGNVFGLSASGDRSAIKDLAARTIDADYAKSVLLLLAKFNLPETSTETIRAFHDSLPYCWMAETAEKNAGKDKLIRATREKLLCPLDPLLRHHVTRIVLRIGTVSLDGYVQDQQQSDERRAALLGRISPQGAKAGGAKRKNVKK